MLSTYFKCTGFASILCLLLGQIRNSKFFTEAIILSLVAILSAHHPKLKPTSVRRQIDKWKISIHSCAAALSSPDLRTLDFFLLGHSQSQLEGKTFFDEAT
jgi:hypothetical protein